MIFTLLKFIQFTNQKVYLKIIHIFILKLNINGNSENYIIENHAIKTLQSFKRTKRSRDHLR